MNNRSPTNTPQRGGDSKNVLGVSGRSLSLSLSGSLSLARSRSLRETRAQSHGLSLLCPPLYAPHVEHSHTHTRRHRAAVDRAPARTADCPVDLPVGRLVIREWTEPWYLWEQRHAKNRNEHKRERQRETERMTDRDTERARKTKTTQNKNKNKNNRERQRETRQ